MKIRLTPCRPQGTVRAPASKSFAHRLLICAALANATSELTIPDTSDDIEATARCLTALGVSIDKHGAEWTVTPPRQWNDGVTLDCEEQDCTRTVGGVVSNFNPGMTGAFPRLGPGVTEISWTGGVTAVEIVPRWWTL